MALMGMPGIYIHSLAGSRNDCEGVKRTGRARSINRAQIPVEALEAEIADPDSLRGRVFGEMIRLLRIRSRQSAFHPDAGQEVLDLGPNVFALTRRNDETGQSILAVHNVTPNRQRIAIADFRRGETLCDLLSGERIEGAEVELGGYQPRWLVREA
jgi:sucrose phosphorylase